MITQGTFAYLPPLTDEEIAAEVRYALGNGWAISIEVTDDPHPRNVLWELWGLPMFDVGDEGVVLEELRACRRAFPHHFVKLSAFDNNKGRETTALSFLVQQSEDPGFRLDRQHGGGRTTRYSLHPYAADLPHGRRHDHA